MVQRALVVLASTTRSLHRERLEVSSTPLQQEPAVRDVGQLQAHRDATADLPTIRPWKSCLESASNRHAVNDVRQPAQECGFTVDTSPLAYKAKGAGARIAQVHEAVFDARRCMICKKPAGQRQLERASSASSPSNLSANSEPLDHERPRAKAVSYKAGSAWPTR